MCSGGNTSWKLIFLVFLFSFICPNIRAYWMLLCGTSIDQTTFQTLIFEFLWIFIKILRDFGHFLSSTNVIYMKMTLETCHIVFSSSPTASIFYWIWIKKSGQWFVQSIYTKVHKRNFFLRWTFQKLENSILKNGSVRT